jgi:hypothetical protein
VLTAINAALPRSGLASASEAAEPGWRHLGRMARSPLMGLGDRAVLRYNEEPPGGWKH